MSKRDAQLRQAVALLQKALGPAPKQPGKSPRNPKRGPSKVPKCSQTGEITISRTEAFGTVTLKQGKVGVVFDITPTALSFLKQISTSFTESQWLRLEVWFVSAVGAMTGGNVGFGLDYSMAKQAPDKLDDISALTPNRVHALRNGSIKIVAPQNALQTRKWYLHSSPTADAVDKGPARVVVYADSATGDVANSMVGTMFLCYTIRMRGTVA